MIGLMLAAGWGTRLRPVTEHCPKPMLPWLDRPLALWAAATMQAAGCTRIAFNTHPLSTAFAPLPEALADWGIEPLWSHEEATFGTGGGLRRFGERIGPVREPLLVYNADIVCSVDLRPLLDHHRREDNVVTLLLMAGEGAAANVDIDPQTGRVLRLPGMDASALSAQTQGRPCVYTGIAVVAPEVLSAMSGTTPSCWIRQGLAPLLAGGGRVGSVLHAGLWADMGTPERMIASLDHLLKAPPTALLPRHRAWVEEGRTPDGHGWQSPASGPREGRVEGTWLLGAGCELTATGVLQDAAALCGTRVASLQARGIGWQGHWVRS